MYLLIDIGNTRVKWQQRDEKNIISSDSVLVENFMDIDLKEIKSLKKVIVSNVNHSIDQKTLGVDRWLAAMGAWKIYGEDVIVINAGTAITIDLIQIDQKRKAHFRGGMILPGIAISLGILNNSTNLIDTEIGQSQYPSLNTKDAVTTGILTSIQGAVNLVCKKLPSDLPILLSGGDADLIFSQSEDDWKSRIKIESDLIFEGLIVLCIKNYFFLIYKSVIEPSFISDAIATDSESVGCG